MTHNADHPQVAVRDPSTGTDILIDLELAPVIEFLWSRGIRTRYSCQGDRDQRHHQAYIFFDDHRSFKKFFTVLADTKGPLSGSASCWTSAPP